MEKIDKIFVITDVDTYESNYPRVTTYVYYYQNKAEKAFQQIVDSYKKYYDIKQLGNEVRVEDKEGNCIGLIKLTINAFSIDNL